MQLSLRVIFLLTMVRSMHGSALKAKDVNQDVMVDVKNFLKRYIHENELEAPSAALSDEQLEIDKKELQKWGLPLCKSCNNATLRDCTGRNMVPTFVDQENCTCITEYTCCPKECAKLTVEQEALTCVEGKRFKQKIRDCCTCDQYVCEDCTKRWNANFTCDNVCDRIKNVEDQYKCPAQECERIPDPNHAIPNCNLDCQDLINGTDNCGFMKKDCMCLKPPSCQPDAPPTGECQTEKKIESDIFQCKGQKTNENQVCEKCWTWTIEITEATFHTVTCDDRCQNKKITPLECGSFNESCVCIEPANCKQDKPVDIACHTLEKVFSTKAFQCGGNDTCTPCYSWKYVAVAQKPVTEQNCDKRCHVVVPLAQECGQHENKCTCTGKAKDFCQPEEPEHINQCYTPDKQLLESYMCGEAGAEGECRQCWQWNWKAPNCTGKYDKLDCNLNCQSKIQEHDACGCLREVCRPHSMIPNCEPAEPLPTPKICYEKPEMNYIDPPVYTAVRENCERCFNWTATRKPIVDTFCQDPDRLPELCWAKWSVKGICKETVETCARKNEECVNTFSDETCPGGLKRVVGWSRCKHERDTCVDCSTLPNEPPPEFPQCYKKETTTILNACPLTTYRKKECQYDTIDMNECPKIGQKRRLFSDVCNCPQVLCTGCTAVTLDIQLIVDSSASVGSVNWNKLMETMANDFLPNMVTSRVAFTRFGMTVDNYRTLDDNTKKADLLQLDYENMMTTHTAAALVSAFEFYNKSARWDDPDVKKVMIVLTDGNHNGDENLKDAAKLWSDKGVHVFAIGIGNVDLSGLKEISQTFVKRLTTFDDLAPEILNELLPEICKDELS